eukprot:6192376-Pleurochrysis_carterae.AAC.1
MLPTLSAVIAPCYGHPHEQSSLARHRSYSSSFRARVRVNKIIPAGIRALKVQYQLSKIHHGPFTCSGLAKLSVNRNIISVARSLLPAYRSWSASSSYEYTYAKTQY